jgi:hypothetical protein
MQSSHGDRQPRVDWVSDWFLDTIESTTTRTNAAPNRLQAETNHTQRDRQTVRLSDVSHGASSTDNEMQILEEAQAEEQIPSVLPGDELIMERDRDRAVKYVCIRSRPCTMLTSA